jgi:hypothetical protein
MSTEELSQTEIELRAQVARLERQIDAMRGLITTGMVFREGIRIQQAICDAGIGWQLGFHDDVDCVYWFLADGVLDERWEARIQLQLSWSGDLCGHETAPFFWVLDRRYEPGEAPKEAKDRLYSQGPADTIEDASRLVFEAIRKLEQSPTAEGAS